MVAALVEAAAMVTPAAMAIGGGVEGDGDSDGGGGGGDGQVAEVIAMRG